MGSKEELLAAVAAAGEQGRKDYEASQAAQQQAQAQAIQSALAAAAGAEPAYQAELSNIISRPYQLAQTRLGEQSAAMNDWFNRTGTNANLWATNMQGLNEAATAAALARASASSSGGGGGGGGGGSSSAPDWYSGLKDTFGTAATAKNAIAAEADALGLTQYKNSGMAPHEAVAKYAEENYGIPAGVAMSWYPQSKEDVKAAKSISAGVEKFGKGRITMRQLKKGIRQGNRQTPGDQTYLRKQAVARAQQLKAQAAAKRRRRRQ